jgi:uncharacterized cysteine cluster protein YcgN (CxxCxxCC family)
VVDVVCVRCGRCCELVDKEGVPIGVFCRYLVRLESGRTLCRVYKVRLGKKIDAFNKCGPRSKSLWNFEGCSLNVLYPDKPLWKKK